MPPTVAAGGGGWHQFLTHRRVPSGEGMGDMELGTRHGHLALPSRLSGGSTSAANTAATTAAAAAAAERAEADEEEGVGVHARLLGGGDGGGSAGVASLSLDRGDSAGGGGAGRRNRENHDGSPRADEGAGNGGGRGRRGDATPAVSAFNAKGPFAAWLDSLSPSLKFVLLVGCVMVSFGLHNILQETLFAMDGFDFGWSLGLLEAVGVLAGSMLERAHGGEVGTRVAPFRSYVVLAGLLGMSSSLSNMALNYIKYPTKVIFRSCKLIPTMAIAVLWRKKIVSKWEFLAAFSVCAGLIIFAQADAKLEPDFHPRGIAMVMLSVCADAFLPNMQEHVFSMGASRVEVTFFTNSLTVLGMVFSTGANGSLFKFLAYAVTSRTALLRMLVYCIMSHVAIAAHMMVLKEYGGVTAVLVGNTRKSMTIALSFLLFPKPFSYHFVLGGALVLGGLVANVMIKERRKGKARKATKSHANLSSLDHAAGGVGSGSTPSGSSGNGGGGGGGGNTHLSRSHSDTRAEDVGSSLGTGGSGKGGGGRGGGGSGGTMDRLASEVAATGTASGQRVSKGIVTSSSSSSSSSSSKTIPPMAT